VAALIATFDLPTERSGPAQFDRRPDAALTSRQRCVSGTIGLAVTTEVEAFRAVMLTGQMTAAAELMMVTQPAITRPSLPSAAS